MFIVLEGSFQVNIEVDGKPLRVADLWPGEYFGEMSLFTGAPRSATVIAQSESIVLEIDKATVAGLFNKHPIFADTVVKVVEERLALNSKKINEKNSAVQSNAKNSVGLLASIKSFFNL
jgi:CRP-like cAMP-binding protein